MLERRHARLLIAAAVVTAALTTPTTPARGVRASFAFQDPLNLTLQTSSLTVTRLEPRQVLERELRSDAADVYEVMVPAGQLARLIVDQGASDLAVTRITPDGSSEEIDGRWHGPEPVSITAAVAGVSRIEVRSTPGAPASVRYRIRVDDLRPTTPTDKQQVEAERLGTEIKRAILQATGQSLREASRKLEALVALWQAVADRYGEAQALHSLGFISNALGRNQDAMAYYGKALTLWRGLEHRVGELQTLSNIGHVQTQLGELVSAVRTYEDVIETRRRTSDSRGVAQALNNLAVTYASLGELERALEQFLEGLLIWRGLADRGMEGAVLANVAATLVGLGRFEEALQRYDEALPLLEGQDPRRLASAVANLGNLQRQLGDHDAALRRYDRARELGRLASDPRVEAQALHNAGIAYHELRAYAKANDAFRAAFELWGRAGDRRGQAISLARIGDVAVETGVPETALDIHGRALSLVREVGDLRSEASILDGMALAFLARGDTGAARENLARGLELSRQVGDRPLEAHILLHLSRALRAGGAFEEALSEIRRAVELVESLRGGVLSPSQRMSFLASTQSFYELYVDLLMHFHRRDPSAGFDARAFEVSERGRARTLLDLLAEARADIRQSIDPALAERERSLRQRLDAKAERQIALLSSKATQAQGKTIGAELDALLDEYRTLQAQIRRTNPRYAALDEARPVDLATLVRELDAETALVTFTLGTDRSFAWVVAHDGIASVELPARARIEEEARRLYGQLAPGSIGAPPAQATTDSGSEAATVLSQMILRPIVTKLRVPRLVVVPDGALQYVPFGALPHPDPPHALLVESYEIITLPSASVLTVRADERPGVKPSKTVAVLADPVFSTSDPRLEPFRSRGQPAMPAATGVSRSDMLTTSVRDVGATGSSPFDLRRLLFSRREAKAIVSLAGSSSSVMAVDFDANRALALSPSLADYRIVHFATHGLLNATRPELSGLVLSLVDEGGRTQPGFLRLHDIYNLRLGAELVVLSACHSALGTEIKGEGLVGLTRGFMYAGARQVVASLWKVDDEATADLMTEFYRSMFRDGATPSAALGQAQRSLRKGTRWASPRHWAAFVIQGDWRSCADPRQCQAKSP